MAQRITPNIWFNGNAEQGGEFYARAFGDVGVEASTTVDARYPSDGLLDFQQHMAGAALTVEVTIAGTRLTLINAGPEFRPNPSISFMLNFDPLMFGGDDAATRERIAALWAALAEGGKEMMGLGEYPFSPYYGWVEDRHGVSWQLMLTDPEGEPRPFIIPALMFDGESQNKAAEASDFYVSLFADSPGGSAVGTRAPYGAPTGDASADALAFGEFRIGDQWFVGSDNGSGVDHPFSCGVSLLVECEDQAEIDRLWDALSAVGEAEQCGWLVDRYGVNWQIVPANLRELMRRPHAYEHMMRMKKLVIDEF